jgi:hypothetical protein
MQQQLRLRARPLLQRLLFGSGMLIERELPGRLVVHSGRISSRHMAKRLHQAVTLPSPKKRAQAALAMMAAGVDRRER